MTMPFRIAKFDPAVQVGYHVKGTLVVTADGGWIEDLAITQRTPASSTTQSAQRGAQTPGVEVPIFR